MPEDWDVYLGPVDDQPASIFVDLSLLNAAPDANRPWLLRVAVQLQRPGEDGLGSQAESEALYEIEDRLFAGVAQSLRARYVGRITTQGRREFFYYAGSADGF